jgi:prepilin-type processing-associated H-X9-DG protein
VPGAKPRHEDTRHFSRRSRSKPGFSAFTLPELLVVIVVIFILGEVIIPGLINTREASMLASCSNNLRQIGVGCNVYATANNDYWPTINLPGSDENFYQTELACRTTSGTSPTTQIGIGPYGFGQLFFYAGMNNPQVFYCPSVETGVYSYSDYDAPGYPWPAMTPIGVAQGDANPFVRCGYNYYPQSKTTETITTPGGNFNLPVVNFAIATFTPPNPPGGTSPNTSEEPVPMKTTQINLSKAVAVDKLTLFAQINHEYRGQPYGLNALFPDGHVRFQPVAGNNKKNSNKPFDPLLWDPNSGGGGEGPGETSYGFGASYVAGIIMAGYQP